MIEVQSKLSGELIRLTEERWGHIVDEHPELTDKLNDVTYTITHPLAIYNGRQGELLALREVEQGKFLVVVYKEAPERFIITAFYTKRKKSFERREKIW